MAGILSAHRIFFLVQLADFLIQDFYVTPPGLLPFSIRRQFFAPFPESFDFLLVGRRSWYRQRPGPYGAEFHGRSCSRVLVVFRRHALLAGRNA